MHFVQKTTQYHHWYCDHLKHFTAVPHFWHAITLTISLHFVEFLLSKNFHALATSRQQQMQPEKSTQATAGSKPWAISTGT